MLSKITGGTQLAELRIGLMGGSFNPPHDGHVHISEVALKRLQLHQLWWLVSPQNPLKSGHDLATLSKRIDQCRALTTNPHIKVRNIEHRLGTKYSIDTIRALQTRFPQTNFCWIIGADNLMNFHNWQAWTEIMDRIPVAAIARPGYHLRAGLSKAAQRYAKHRFDPSDAASLTMFEPPAWTLILDKLHPLSSTALRQRRKQEKGKS